MKNKLSFSALLILFLTFSSFRSFAQTCEVEKESIKGAYTGDCKKGKAHGKGKSAGADTYEGDFKSGLPDGQGTYTWSNKSVFTGRFVKGLREGKGMMTIKRENAPDSIVDGYWKKDAYIGKHENPWLVHSKTGSVRDVKVEFTPDIVHRVKIVVTNTTGGVPSLGGQLPKISVTNVVILKGNYDRLTSLETHYKSSESTLTEVAFPFHIKFNLGTEQVEVEFFEAGSYTVNISVNN